MGILGYGPQGQGQSLNLRDNGVKVIIGQRKGGPGWDATRSADGWVEGKTLFDGHRRRRAAGRRSSSISSRTRDRKNSGPCSQADLKKGQALCFSHGFSVVFRDQTGVVPPKDVDVVLVAPKGAGRTVRSNFLAGSGINSSFAVHQDATGRARERVIALGIAIGSGYLFPTTFEKEVHSDLTGERGVLLGAIAGLMKAQYETLRAMGHSPSEAFNETVEEATQSLYPLMGQKGVDWMISSVQHDRAARRAGLVEAVRDGDQAALRAAVPRRPGGRGDEAGARYLRRDGLPREARGGAGRVARIRDVEGRRRRALPPPRELEEEVARRSTSSVTGMPLTNRKM